MYTYIYIYISISILILIFIVVAIITTNNAVNDNGAAKPPGASSSVLPFPLVNLPKVSAFPPPASRANCLFVRFLFHYFIKVLHSLQDMGHAERPHPQKSDLIDLLYLIDLLDLRGSLQELPLPFPVSQSRFRCTCT